MTVNRYGVKEIKLKDRFGKIWHLLDLEFISYNSDLLQEVRQGNLF